MLIPYIDVFLSDKKTLKEITIGPLIEKDIATRATKLYLNENGYEGVEVTPSEVTIRY